MKNLLLLILISIVFISCESDGIEDIGQIQTCLVTNITAKGIYSKDVTYKLTYDDLKRIIKAESTQDCVFTSYTSTYLPDKILYKPKYFNTYECTLNSKGFISRIDRGNKNSANFTTVNYNSSDQIISTKASFETYPTTFDYDNNGNIIKITYKDNYNSIQISEITYYDQKSIIVSPVFEIYYTGLIRDLHNYYGKSNNYLVKSIKSSYLTNNIVTYSDVINYTYQFDNSNKLISFNKKRSSPHTNSEANYFLDYTCK